MHELSLCEAIAARVVERAGGRRVVSVRVQIGHLRQVVPDAMSFSWDVLAAGSDLDGAALEIDYVPATVHCRTCAALTTLDAPVLACAACGAIDVDLRTGEELTLVSFEVAGPAVTDEDEREDDDQGQEGAT